MQETRRDTLLRVATDALAGRLADITIRRSGSLALLNAAKELMWTGYSPEAELLKGLIVRVDPATGAAVDLVAACLPKFYNYTENVENDASFMAALGRDGAVLRFTLKVDGSNIRPYINPNTGAIEFATRGMLRSDGSGDEGFLDFSSLAREIATERAPALLDPALIGRYTVIAELIHPDNRILTNYGERRDLVVITVVDLATGVELDYPETVAFCEAHGLSFVEQLQPDATDFLGAVVELRRSFLDTDIEGTVAAVAVPGEPVPYRLKIKGETYLHLLALARRCTLKRAVGLIEERGLRDWDAFVAYLREEIPDLPEEVTAAYRVHFGRWTAWNAAAEAEADRILADYLALPARASESQKEFALAIAAGPSRSAFFALRRAEQQGDLDAGRVAVADAVRKATRDAIRDAEVDEEEAA